MRGALIAVFIGALLCAGAAAQPTAPPVENVTVTGTKSRETINSFVQSLVVPTHATDKLARWQTGICPIALGLKPAFLQFITQHIKDAAKKVGAPVDGDPACAPNIEIVFTTTPQALLENIKKNHAGFLGYYDGSPLPAGRIPFTRICLRF